MHYHAVEPPLGPSTSTYAGVAMVTLGTTLTLSVVLVACSFFRKIRSGTNDSSAQTAPGTYVAESYANPAFLELPFDGSCTSSADIPYDFSVATTVSVHVHPHQTTSTRPANAPNLSPKSVVAKATGPTPYQAEPRYCVQGNVHTDPPREGVSSAIHGVEDRTLNDPGGRGHCSHLGDRQSSADLVYANDGAKESFKKPHHMRKSAENPHSGHQSRGGSKSSLDANGEVANNPALVIDNNNGKCESPVGQGGIDSHHKDSEQQISKQHQHDGSINRIDPMSGTTETASSSKRVRISLESLSAPREIGITQQQRKKPKMSPDGNADAVGPVKQSPGRSRVRRKGSKNSFSRVKKPVFHPRKKGSSKAQPKAESGAEVVIQNPLVAN